MNNTSMVSDIIKDYGRKSPFASFLPGIAGVKGTPIWCYYVNRGQAVVSFGVADKDHSIMEFYPAHTAYQTVTRTGFRTFVRIDGKYFEPFKNPQDESSMEIHMNALFLENRNEEHALKTSVKYTTLPGEEIGALVRIVTITNESDSAKELEVADGMPALVPYGFDIDGLKNMVQTRKAWMQVEDIESKKPYYRARVSTEDSAVVKMVDAGNFGAAINDRNEQLGVIVDPGVIFDYDLSLERAVTFENGGIAALSDKKQNTSNEFPCCFFIDKRTLGAGESMTLYELIGQVRNKDVLDSFMNRKIDCSYFEKKLSEAEALTDELTDAVGTKTANKTFDDYTRYNYMDNVLRGGTPISLPGGHTFYVYSRKHGDLERDYNYFSMSPEFFSQGNGNFRDVNQNRRCDTFFSPIVGDGNIRRFYSLIQLDGYNPLKIEQLRFTTDRESLGELAIKLPFTPGELVSAIKDSRKGISDEELWKSFDEIMTGAKEVMNDDFGEGYWSDHWTYNLDLVEDFLEVYPDREKELLDTKISSFEAKVKLLPRYRRYEVTENGVRQYYYLEARDNAEKKSSFELDKSGKEISMTLLSKLYLMSLVKFAAIDAEGMGVEMEGGKPGWYDALNGMPGMMGSSMNESYELLRMVRFVIKEIEKYGCSVTLPLETAGLAFSLKDIEENFVSDFDAWMRRNDAKENYRAKIYDRLCGDMKELTKDQALDIIRLIEKRLEKGISKAFDLGEGIAPSYFTYEIDEYEKDGDAIMPKHFAVSKVPYFLEGPVRFLKLENTYEEKRKLYDAVKSSDLFDGKLSMYKVNASLLNDSFELGRCRAFTPGWLENESIWLHMEYKYLLELIRSGLYAEFFEDLKKAAIPFLDKETYGRSTLENSSFIASSKNPNESIHGKGFVARLSGSTIEFISMWKLMFFGRDVFTLEDGELTFRPQPAIPEYLISEEGGKYEVSSTLLGHVRVTYDFAAKKDYFPGKYEITSIEVNYADGSEETFEGAALKGDAAKRLRDGDIKALTIKVR